MMNLNSGNITTKVFMLGELKNILFFKKKKQVYFPVLKYTFQIKKLREETRKVKETSQNAA